VLRVASCGDGATVIYLIKYIDVKVLVFIKDYQAQVLGVLIIFMLLAGFIPLLQIVFIGMIGRIIYWFDSL
jgi:hypothetical protein